MNYSNREIFSTLDLENFSWLPLWKKDQELREKIEKCQEEIRRIKKSPFSREEVKRQFELARDIFRENRLKLIKKEAENIQTARIANELINTAIPFYQSSILNPEDSKPLTSILNCYSVFEIPEVWQEIEQIIVKLPKGLSQKEKTELIKKEEAKINNYYQEINEKLSPRSRWLHDKRGNPRPYPRGCRWTRYVDVLKIILPFLEELANIDNKPLNSEARKHFKECGFHKLVGTAKIDRLFKLKEQVRVSMPVNLDSD